MTPTRPSPRGWLHRLDAQLVAGFLLVSLVPVLIVATGLTWRGARLAESYVSEHVERTASSYAAGLDLYVERHRGRLRDLALQPDDTEALTAAVRADPSLEALWFAAAEATSDPAPAGWARAACAALASDAGSVMTHAGHGHAHSVVLAVQRPDGLLCGQVTFTVHQEMMTEQADSSLGGSAYIVDRDGVVVCYAFDESQAHVSRGELLSPEVAAVAGAAHTWAGTVGAGDSKRFAAFDAAHELPWGVWVEVPSDQAVAPFRDGLGQGGLLAGLVALLAAGIAVLLARRMAAPVRRLAEASGRVAAGELGARVPVGGPSEIAALAVEFNSMSGALARSHAELEGRVADRTRELAQARAFSDRLLDTMRQRILVIDPDQRVVRANQAAQQAYGDDLVGSTCEQVHRPRPGQPCPARAVLDSGAPSRVERVEREGDAAVVLSVETVPLTDEAGQIVGALEIGQDITEVKRIRARLAQQERMAAVGTLAAGLAHEIGNPLASISSELEMLERMWDPDDARAALPVLRDQVRRMSGLLRELVDFGRPPTQQPGPVAPADLLAEVARLLRHDPRSRGVEITVEPDAPERLCTNRDRVVQVLVNLGLNALDAVEADGAVSLRAARDPVGDVRLIVEDDGPGVPDDRATRVFDPFYTTKEPGRGAGLGLFVSERIVQGLGGRIDLRTGGPGARFTVVLPACACGGARCAPAPSPDSPDGTA